MKTILFACKENQNLCQIAETFAKKYGKRKVFVTDSKYLRVINAAIESKEMKRNDLTLHTSIENFSKIKIDYLITFGRDDKYPFITFDHHENWDISGTGNIKKKYSKVVHDIIEQKVKQLIIKIIQAENE